MPRPYTGRSENVFRIRVSPEEKSLLEHAAALREEAPSVWARNLLLEAAKTVVFSHEYDNLQKS
jgi:uncharacterized protein (DUF1778 family)